MNNNHRSVVVVAVKNSFIGLPMIVKPMAGIQYTLVLLVGS